MYLYVRGIDFTYSRAPELIPFAWWVGLLIISFFCVVLLCVFTFWVPCWDVYYDFRIKTMFGSSLPPVVFRRVHVLFTLFVFVFAQWCPMHIVLRFCFCFCFCFFGFLRFVYPVLPVSLGCLFLIAPSILSNVHFLSFFHISINLLNFRTFPTV